MGDVILVGVMSVHYIGVEDVGVHVVVYTTRPILSGSQIIKFTFYVWVVKNQVLHSMLRMKKWV